MKMPDSEKSQNGKKDTLGFGITIAVVAMIFIGFFLANGVTPQISISISEPTTTPISTATSPIKTTTSSTVVTQENPSIIYYIAPPPEKAYFLGNDHDETMSVDTKENKKELALSLGILEDPNWEQYSLIDTTPEIIYSHYKKVLEQRHYSPMGMERYGDDQYYMLFSFGKTNISIFYVDSNPKHMVVFNWKSDTLLSPLQDSSIRLSGTIEPPSNASLEASNSDSSQETKDNVALHARNLAVPSGYDWEYYSFPSTTRFADIEKHYTSVLGSMGYRKTYDDEGMNGVYLLKYKSRDGLIIVQFWESEKEILVFYSIN